MYEFLEGESIGYTIRLPANRVLQDRIGYLLKRPVGRPPHENRDASRCPVAGDHRLQHRAPAIGAVHDAVRPAPTPRRNLVCLPGARPRR
jgi:hypothetical protein